jgi:hypothetical protein
MPSDHFLLDQNPEIRGIGNLIYGIAWIGTFIFFVDSFSFIVNTAAESSVSGPLPPGPTPPMQTLMAAIVRSYIYVAELSILKKSLASRGTS